MGEQPRADQVTPGQQGLDQTSVFQQAGTPLGPQSEERKTSLDEETGGVDVEIKGSGKNTGKDGEGIVAGKQDDKVTAKDLFSQMNRKQGHESKDKERKFSAGAPAAGTGNGGGQASGGGQPSAPVVGYKAPQIAQNANIVTGTSSPTQPASAVAVPVQIEGSALLGQQHPPDNMTQPPVSGTEEKAKARAQKYLFDTEKDLDDARNQQDILNKKDRVLPDELSQILHDDNDKEKSEDKGDK